MTLLVRMRFGSTFSIGAPWEKDADEREARAQRWGRASCHLDPVRGPELR